MNRAMSLMGMLLLVAAGGASGQEPKQPTTGASAQGAATTQGNVSASREGAAASGSAAGAANSSAGSGSASLAQGSEINATLTKPVDAGKAKPGDPVEARAAKDSRSDGEVVVPRGSRLMGHVTQARPRGEGSAKGDSTLGIVFDRAVLKDGRTVALNGAVTALGAAHAASSPGPGAGMAGGGDMGGSAAGSAGGLAGSLGGTVGGAVGATTSTVGHTGALVGGTASAAAHSAGAVGGFDAGGGLRSGSRGVFGLRDLEITSASSGAAEGSVISSAGRNVHLESGTQMLVVAGARAGKQSADSADTAGQRAREEQKDNR